MDCASLLGEELFLPLLLPPLLLSSSSSLRVGVRAYQEGGRGILLRNIEEGDSDRQRDMLGAVGPTSSNLRCVALDVARGCQASSQQGFLGLG